MFLERTRYEPTSRHRIATVGHLGDDSADLWQRAERLCRAVAAQELANLPLYIVPQSRLAELGFADDQHGLTCLSLDLFVREYLEDYRGRGPAMVINEDAIREGQPSRRCRVHHLGHGAA